MDNRETMLGHTQKPPWAADQGDGTYINPILYADYSDPDVIRVGEDFYMTASSFNHVPGLPILHSKDLVNWSLIGHVLPQLPLPGYDIPQHGKGVWAPSLRHHNGKFWVFFGAPDEGIFMSTAEDPAGPWSPLHLVQEGKGLIDPCPFWDEDGQAYLVHAFAFSRCGIKHKLRICRMAPDGTKLLEDGPIVFDGTENHPTMEGPKMYKRNGYYYIFAPAGGVPTGWQTILRSRSVYGPYEDKIVLHQGDTPVNGPHQGGFVELESGESWFLHFQDQGAFGRIVHLQPVRWVEDWPLMGVDTNGDGIGEPVLRYPKPNVGREYPTVVPGTSDYFQGNVLGLQWQWQANPQPGWHDLSVNPGHLRLHAKPIPENATNLYGAPQLLLQKFPAPSFTAEVPVRLQPEDPSDLAGLLIFGQRYAYLGLRLHPSGDTGFQLVQREGDVSGEETVWSLDLPEAGRLLHLKVAINEEAMCQFSYSTNGTDYKTAGKPFTAQEGRWVGAKVGIFALRTDAAAEGGYADFGSFVVAAGEQGTEEPA